MPGGRPKRTEPLTQEEYDNLPYDKQDYYRRFRPDLMIAVKPIIKQIRNRTEPFTLQEYKNMSPQLKCYYKNNKPELLIHIQ